MLRHGRIFQLQLGVSCEAGVKELLQLQHVTLQAFHTETFCQVKHCLLTSQEIHTRVCTGFSQNNSTYLSLGNGCSSCSLLRSYNIVLFLSSPSSLRVQPGTSCLFKSGLFSSANKRPPQTEPAYENCNTLQLATAIDIDREYYNTVKKGTS